MTTFNIVINEKSLSVQNGFKRWITFWGLLKNDTLNHHFFMFMWEPSSNLSIFPAASVLKTVFCPDMNLFLYRYQATDYNLTQLNHKFISSQRISCVNLNFSRFCFIFTPACLICCGPGRGAELIFTSCTNSGMDGLHRRDFQSWFLPAPLFLQIIVLTV